MKKGIMLLTIMITLTGCRNVKEPIVFTPVSSSQVIAQAYYAINKIGVVHLDTIFYLDETMTAGIPIEAGESVFLIGESETNYLMIYGEYKGYIRKNHVLILDYAENTEETSGRKAASVPDKVVVEEHIEEHIETMIITQKETRAGNVEENDDTEAAAPPPTMYTANKQNDNSYSNKLISSINKERKSANLNSLQTDSKLNKEAEYYCDIFVKKNSAQSISGYSVQAVGKIRNTDDLNKIGKNIVKSINGFNDNKTSKVGVSVIESDKGYLCYVVIAK